MRFNKLLPEEVTDEQIIIISDFLSELSIEFDKKHYSQICRYYKEWKQSTMSKCTGLPD